MRISVDIIPLMGRKNTDECLMLFIVHGLCHFSLLDDVVGPVRFEGREGEGGNGMQGRVRV